MSDSDVSSTLWSCINNTYGETPQPPLLITSSSSDDHEEPSVQILEANIAAEGDPAVTQPMGNDQNEEAPEANQGPNQPANEPNVIPPHVSPYIGLIICKECNGTKYLGKVVGYNIQRKWFRVEYREEEFEDMDEDTVLRLRAKQSDIFAVQADQPSSWRSTTTNHGAGLTKKKAASRKSSKKDENPYIPLALRETKRDAFFYY